MMQDAKPRALAAPRDRDELMPQGGTARPGTSMTRAQTSGGHFTAMQVAVKRIPEEVKKEVAFEAAELGKDCFYAWEVNDRTSKTGKSLIKGMSIDGSMMIARLWGNCFVDVGIEEESPREWVLKATFVDHQTGFTASRLYRQRKSESHAKMDGDRALDIAFQIGQSKAIRNVVVNAMPAWLIRQAMDIATQASEKDFANLDAALADAKAVFGAWGVTEEQLIRKIGKPFAQWLARDHVVLSSIYKAIKEGMTTVAAEFSDAPAVGDDDDEPDSGKPEGAETKTAEPPPRAAYGNGGARPSPPPAAPQASPAKPAAAPASPAPAQREAGDPDPYEVPGVPPPGGTGTLPLGGVDPAKQPPKARK